MSDCPHCWHSAPAMWVNGVLHQGDFCCHCGTQISSPSPGVAKPHGLYLYLLNPKMPTIRVVGPYKPIPFEEKM